MTTYFFDTSAIIKRYAPNESGHRWIAALCDPEHGHALFLSQVALVEVIAAICRKVREQHIVEAERDQLISRFRRDVRNDYDLWRVTSVVYTFAGDLCRLYRLRAYDAMQLACVIKLRERTLAHSIPAPIFVCADHDLLSIANAEGLGTENPNQYS